MKPLKVAVCSTRLALSSERPTDPIANAERLEKTAEEIYALCADVVLLHQPALSNKDAVSRKNEQVAFSKHLSKAARHLGYNALFASIKGEQHLAMMSRLGNRPHAGYFKGHKSLVVEDLRDDENGKPVKIFGAYFNGPNEVESVRSILRCQKSGAAIVLAAYRGQEDVRGNAVNQATIIHTPKLIDVQQLIYLDHLDGTVGSRGEFLFTPAGTTPQPNQLQQYPNRLHA